MARGWESKSVEDQINARQDQSKKPTNPSSNDIQRQSLRGGLIRARDRTLQALEAAKDADTKAYLQRALDDIDARLKELE